MASKDRINHIHYRNVTVQTPYTKYEEVFFDVGVINLFAVMQEIIKTGYKLGIYPEHPRALDFDKEHPGGIRNQYPGGGGYTGQVFNVAYTRAMMQAALSI
jgi:mannonate dehydratase